MRARSVRSTPHGPRHAVPYLVAAALMTTTLTACGTDRSGGDLNPNGTFANGTPPPNAPGAPGTPPPSALPTPQVNQSVLARYREYQKVFKRIYEVNDPTELATVAIDPLLNRVTKDVEATKAKNEIWRFTNVSNPKVYARSPDGMTVYVADCIRTLAGYRFSAKTGKRTGGGTGDAYLHRIAVRYDAGTWKVSNTVRDKKC